MFGVALLIIALVLGLVFFGPSARMLSTNAILERIGIHGLPGGWTEFSQINDSHDRCTFGIWSASESVAELADPSFEDHLSNNFGLVVQSTSYFEVMRSFSHSSAEHELMDNLIFSARGCEHHPNAQVEPNNQFSRQFMTMMNDEMDYVALDRVCGLFCRYRATLINVDQGEIVYFE